MHLLRTTRRVGYLFAAGAATAYFLDPESGAARRAKVVDQVRALAPERDEIADLAGQQPTANPRPAANATADPAEGAIHIDAEQMTDGSGDAFPPRMESDDHRVTLEEAEIH